MNTISFDDNWQPSGPPTPINPVDCDGFPVTIPTAQNEVPPIVELQKQCAGSQKGDPQ